MATRARDLVLGAVGGALLLWAIAVVEIALGGHPARMAAVATAAIAPLALRRVAPGLPLLALGLIAVVDELTGAGWFELNAPVAVVLVAAFACSAHSGRWSGAGAGLAAIALFALTDLLGGNTPEVQGLALAVGMPWLAGSAVRVQRARTVQLRSLTERLQREPDTVAQLALAEECERLAVEVDDAVGHAITTMVCRPVAPSSCSKPIAPVPATRSSRSSRRDGLASPSYRARCASCAPSRRCLSQSPSRRLSPFGVASPAGARSAELSRPRW
jgi:hypothetical protein